MKMNRVIGVVVFGFSLFVGSIAGTQPGQAEQPDAIKGLSCPFVGPIQGVYFNQHISYTVTAPNEEARRQEIEKRTVEQYVKRLDGSKLYFLDQDVKDIQAKLKGILSAVEKRPVPDCDQLHKAQDVFVKRVKERVAFANKYLGKDFKFKKETKLILDPERRKYPVSQTEADEFQKEYIQILLPRI